MVNWDQWRRHIDHTVADTGQWVGLLDGDWQPICTMPPLLDLTAATNRLAAGEVQATFDITSHHRPTHPVADRLIADKLGKFDDNGRISPAIDEDLNLAVIRPGSRQVYFITHTESEGTTAPTTLTAYGTDLIDLLDATPCPSNPKTWGMYPITTRTEDAGGTYTTPRQYGPVEMADVADGYTYDDPADIALRRCIQDSVDAVIREGGFTRPHIAVQWDTPTPGAPRMVLRPQDETIWACIQEPALLAGATINASLWWPGDDPFPVRHHPDQPPALTSYDHPIAKIEVSITGKE